MQFKTKVILKDMKAHEVVLRIRFHWKFPQIA